MVHLIFPPDDSCCHGIDFWDKIDYKSVPVKDNCALFAPTLYFRARIIRLCHLNLSPDDPCCHGNEFWDKVDYNSASVKDNCALFAPNPVFSGPGYLMLSFKILPFRLLPSPWQPIVFIQRQNWLQHIM